MAIRNVAEVDPLVLAQERLNNFSPVVFQAMWNTMHEALAHARECLTRAQAHIAKLESMKQTKRGKSVKELETRAEEFEIRVRALVEQLVEKGREFDAKKEELDASEQRVEELKDELREEQLRFDELLADVQGRARQCQTLLNSVLGPETVDNSLDVHNFRRAFEDLASIDRRD